jgi:hypothetical protein
MMSKGKKVRQEKKMPQNVRANFVERCQKLLNEIDQAKSEGRTIVYQDEICFTKRSVTLREWSQKNTNLTIDQEEIYCGYRVAVASMTEQ